MKSKMRSPIVILSSLMVALMLAGCPANGQGSHDDDTKPHVRTVSVQGDGVVVLEPDIAFIDAGVVTQAETAKDALSENAAMMNKVFAQLKDLGVADRDMRTANLSVTPQYDRRKNSEEPMRIIGYNAANRLQLKIRDLDQLGAILDAVVSSGVNQVSGPTFSVDDPEPAREEARKLAVLNAMEHANTLTETAGAGLGEVISISENSGYRPMPQQRVMATMEMAAAPTPVAAGELEIRVSVNAVFRIQ